MKQMSNTKFHVITPMARFENIRKLIDNMKHQNIIWHVIIDDDNPKKFEYNEPFIFLHICPNKTVEFWTRCNNSINWFIENYDLKEDDYYGILNDDDAYEETFFDKLRNKLENKDENSRDLIIVSMKRGHHIPEGIVACKRHPTNTLLAQPESMFPCRVGVEQFFLKGKYLKKHRLPLTVYGDGELISALAKEYAKQVFYIPDVFVLFNYFEPGRWEI
jgi:hypothetical protein